MVGARWRGVGYFIGHICLGLRSDYLAIATLGIAEIIKAFLKTLIGLPAALPPCLRSLANAGAC